MLLQTDERIAFSGFSMIFRSATAADLPRLIEMLVDDPLGATRERFEDPLPKPYSDAFAAIETDPANELVVAEIGTPASRPSNNATMTMDTMKPTRALPNPTLSQIRHG